MEDKMIDELREILVDELSKYDGDNNKILLSLFTILYLRSLGLLY